MADNPTQTYCPVCERPIKTNAQGLVHRHKSGTNKAEVCPGSGQTAVDEAIIIAAAIGGVAKHCVNDPMTKKRPIDSERRVDADQLHDRVSPTESAIFAPRAPNGFGDPSVESRAVWCSVSAFSFAPSRITATDSHIQVMKPMIAPREP